MTDLHAVIGLAHMDRIKMFTKRRRTNVVFFNADIILLRHPPKKLGIVMSGIILQFASTEDGIRTKHRIPNCD